MFESRQRQTYMLVLNTSKESSLAKQSATSVSFIGPRRLPSYGMSRVTVDVTPSMLIGHKCRVRVKTCNPSLVTVTSPCIYNLNKLYRSVKEKKGKLKFT